MKRRPSTTTLLSASVVGVYVLVVVGATAALADAAAACGGWPACDAALSPAVAVVLLHRAAAVAVGLLVVATGLLAWTDLDGRSRAAVGVALVGYPIQAGLGALVATGRGVAGAHLLVAMGIFGALVVALAWHLEAETGTDDAAAATDPSPSPDPEPALDEPVPEPAPLSALDGAERLRETAWAYFQLTKPRLMWLLCLVAGAGMALAGSPSMRTVVATLGGGVLAIGASGTFNHVLERDVDRRMERTADRPVATHEVPVRNALVFGGLLTVASLGAFLSVNLLAAALGLAAVVFPRRH